MAKKPTTAKSAETSVLSAAGNSVEKTTAKPAPKKATKAKPSPKTKEAKPAKATAARTRVKATAVTKSTVSITPADIALRAYFISEKRQKLGLPGDSTHDWVEAERQLKAEAARKK